LFHKYPILVPYPLSCSIPALRRYPLQSLRLWDCFCRFSWWEDESHLFTVKDDKFKSKPFLREVKAIYTDLINRHISDPEQQLRVLFWNIVYHGK
jgi:hypothetical protein